LIKLINVRKEFILTIQRATRLVIYLAYSVHWFACFWIWLGHQNGDEGWIETNSDFVRNSNSDIYIAAMYSIVTTFSTVGYGDILGTSNSEYIFQSILELCGIGFFGYIIGNINSTIVNSDSIAVLKEAKDEQVNIWLMRLQRAYKERIINHEYYLHTSSFFSKLWDKDYHTVRKSDLFKKLKPQLQNEL
jgi:hypothetical protein